MEIGILIASFIAVAAIAVGLLWSVCRRASDPEGDWWDLPPDTTVEHRTRMFQGRDVTEIGRTPDAET